MILILYVYFLIDSEIHDEIKQRTKTMKKRDDKNQQRKK